QWCLDRSGEPLSASARLLFAGGGGVAGEVRRRVVLTLPSEVVTDGVCQWPETADLLDDRLGPCTVAVAEADLGALLGRLAGLGGGVGAGRGGGRGGPGRADGPRPAVVLSLRLPPPGSPAFLPSAGCEEHAQR